MGIEQRYARVADQVAAAAEAAGRNPSEVRLVAVSKTVGVSEAAEALAAGAQDFGENRPDELARKQQALPQARWHFIGNIQSRRIPEIVAHASLVHSLDQLRHAQRMDAAAAAIGKVQDVLVEVNVSGEESKGGVPLCDASDLVLACAELPHLRVRGLMTMAPRGDQREARACFEELAALKGRLRAQLPAEEAVPFDELSMGMSEDWRCAIEAGATMVRIGRAVFSEEFE